MRETGSTRDAPEESPRPHRKPGAQYEDDGIAGFDVPPIDHLKDVGAGDKKEENAGRGHVGFHGARFRRNT